MTLDGSAHFLCLQSQAFSTELSWQVLIEGSFTPLLFVQQLTFGLKDLAEINRAWVHKDL